MDSDERSTDGHGVLLPARRLSPMAWLLHSSTAQPTIPQGAISQ